MFPSAALLATVTLALSAVANPIVVPDSVVSLPLAKRFNFTSAASILQHDQARAKGLQAFGSAKAAARNGKRASVLSVPAVNEVVNYALNVSGVTTFYDCMLILLVGWRWYSCHDLSVCCTVSVSRF